MNLFHKLKAALIFARYQAWVDAPDWNKGDAIALTAFLASPTGTRVREQLRNTVLRQQAHALTKTDGLVYEAGWCGGQKGLIAVIESMADVENFTDRGEQDADPGTNQQES